MVPQPPHLKLPFALQAGVGSPCPGSKSLHGRIRSALNLPHINPEWNLEVHRHYKSPFEGALAWALDPNRTCRLVHPSIPISCTIYT